MAGGRGGHDDWAWSKRREASGAGAQVHAENAILRDTIEFLIERLACAERRPKAPHSGFK